LKPLERATKLVLPESKSPLRHIHRVTHMY